MLSGITMFLIQEKILFQPKKLPSDFEYNFAHDFEEVDLSSADGAIINALHFKVNDPKGIILYFHGNRGNLVRWGGVASYFVDRGYDVFVMDYRTYGKSTGRLSEDALFADAKMCFDYLLQEYAEHDITIYGRSLGTGIAAQLASYTMPKQLILETPYYSINDVARRIFPIFPVKYLLNYKLESNQYLKKVSCFITIFHGTADGVVPYDSGKNLYESIPSVSKKLVTIKNGRHKNLIQFDEYHQGISEILP